MDYTETLAELALYRREVEQLHNCPSDEFDEIMSDLAIRQKAIKEAIGSLKQCYDRRDLDQASQINNLGRNFKDLVLELMKIQSNRQRQLREQAMELYRSANPSATDEQTRYYVETVGHDRVLAGKLNERRDDTAHLERSAKELCDITTDLHDLVMQQDVIMDRTAANLDVAHDYQDKGAVDLEAALRHAKKANFLRIVLACIVAVILVAAVVGLVLEFKSI